MSLYVYNYRTYAINGELCNYVDNVFISYDNKEFIHINKIKNVVFIRYDTYITLSEFTNLESVEICDYYAELFNHFLEKHQHIKKLSISGSNNIDESLFETMNLDVLSITNCRFNDNTITMNKFIPTIMLTGCNIEKYIINEILYNLDLIKLPQFVAIMVNNFAQTNIIIKN